MEGVGSRLSRTSSRYSGPTATAVFTGRVRKWKKKWVHVSTSSTAGSRASKSNGRGNTGNLFLCRWTPLSPASSAAGETEEPPRRRFRYAPIAMLEQREKGASSKQEAEAEEEEEETEEFETETPSPKNVELNMNLMTMDTDQTSEEPKTGRLDLGVCLKDLNDEDSHVD
ncbi:PREDICTED: uncharacterized protein LOC104817682 [Tarenaya hassleriana]|uniref:uncharacterized protein LOC104817682 n=1 Tax=Tarenaya hassleriana TaxID=28532 RepID=UPI00053C9207|nr:PREDICTED: uncharacterized protein LOC104817682 [Tarenaya hassleriana]